MKTPLLKTFLFFLIVICFLGCSVIKIPGVYRSRDGFYKFSLRSDSTFSYTYKFQFRSEYSTGNFILKRNEVMTLNSNMRNKKLLLNVKKNSPSELNEITSYNVLNVDFSIPNNDSGYYECQLFLNDKLYKTKNCDSLKAIVIKEPVKNFFFKIYGDFRMPERHYDTLSTETFTTEFKNNNNLKIDVQFNDTLFNYKIFDDCKVKISNKKMKILWNQIPINLFRIR